MNIKEELEKLAQSLVNHISNKDTPFPDKLDTFKELRAYYAMILKHPADTDEEVEEGFTFGNGADHGRVQRRGSS